MKVLIIHALFIALAVSAQAQGQCLSRTVSAAGKTIYTRCRIDTLSPAQIASLQKGIAVMRGRNTAAQTSTAFRTSWVNWANTHLHYGTTPIGKFPMQAKLIMVTGHTTVPPDWPFQDWNPTPDQKRVWAWCPHHQPLPVDFLAWHRVYLYFFERTLRAASGDPDLTIPYWDHAGDAAALLAAPPAAPPTTIAVPTAYLKGGPLYQHWQDIDKLAPMDGNVSAAFSTTDTLQFSKRIELSPHDSIHGDLGGFMNSTKSAAYTQIFFAHHAEIDRLWDCWESRVRAAGLTPAAIASNTDYSFLDEHGVEQRKTLAAFLAQIDADPTAETHYDQIGYCPTLRLAPEIRAQIAVDNGEPGRQVFMLKGVRKAVAEVPADPNQAPQPVILNSAAGASASKTVLLAPAGQGQLRNTLSRATQLLEFDNTPIQTGRVFLSLTVAVHNDLPARNVRVFVKPSGAAAADDGELVGMISPFTLEHSEMSMMHDGHDAKPLSIEFDVTDAMRKFPDAGSFTVVWKVPAADDSEPGKTEGALEFREVHFSIEDQQLFLPN